jgi:hypothetical protein
MAKITKGGKSVKVKNKKVKYIQATRDLNIQ